MRKRYLHNTYGENGEFWDRTWERGWLADADATPPVFPGLTARIMRYLKPDMRVLEGGCGDARYVRYFADQGLRVVGIDFAKDTIRRIRERMPDLDVCVGDIRDTGFPDGCFDAYYSGGVIEHFEDGVDRQLAEAHRVLKAGGVFFVTVPHMNVSRRCASLVCRMREKLDLDGRKSCCEEGLRMFCVDRPPADFHFHEYVFTTGEMRRFLARHRFRVVEEASFSSPHGLCDIGAYRRLAGLDRENRTLFHKACAAPLRCLYWLEECSPFKASWASGMVGAVLGNLKLYICRAEN